MSGLELDCIESWKRVLPDFQIKRWDENNFKFEAFQFSREAYKVKKYAFVSDVCRLFALYQYGGIYLDTDMLVLKDFSPLLYNTFFIGEEDEGIINAAIIASEMESETLKILLDGYRETPFDFERPLHIPTYLTSRLDRRKVMVYSKEYFYPLPFKSRGEAINPFITSNSFAVHLWNYSWRNEWSYLHEKQFRKSWEQYLRSVRIRGFNKMSVKFLMDFLKFLLADMFPWLHRNYKKSEKI